MLFRSSKINSTLTKQNRLELVEYFKAGIKDSVVNIFKGRSTLLKLDTINQQLIVQTSNNSVLEMKLINLKNEKLIIGIIKTISSSAVMSSVKFYDTAWNVVPLQFTMPKSIAWLKNDVLPTLEIDNKWITTLLQKSVVYLSFDTASSNIIAKNGAMDLMDESTKKLITPLLKSEPIVYKLEGQSWIAK